MRFAAALAAAVAVFLVVATATGHADHLNLRLRGLPRQHITRRVWLRQAGVTVTPAQFWAVSAAAAAAAGLVCWGVGGSWAVGVVPAAAAGLGPRAYFGRRRVARLGAVVAAWPQGVRDLLVSVQSRMTVHHAVVELARTGPAPLRDALADYEVLAALNDIPAALATIREQLADPVSDRVLELLRVAHQEGQSLTLRVLGEQSGEIAEDLRTTAEIRNAQNEPRIVAGAAFAMPWAALVLICAGVPAYRQLYSTATGATAVLVAAVFSTLGLVVARRLVREMAEPRVLGGEEP